MNTGAVIIAANMSKRMEVLKDLIEEGDMSFAGRIVTNFRRAGVGEIVIVTGFQGRELEKELKNTGVVFIRNNDYKTSDMFRSGLMGLEYLRHRCSYVFFSPVDIPFFTSETVNEMQHEAEKEGADVVVPYCDGRSGHPLLLSRKAVEYVLAYRGDNGMRGACGSFVSTGAGRILSVSVGDPGAVIRADSPENYKKLLMIHNAGLLRPEITVRICGNKDILDRNATTFLKQIDIFESVREACTRCGISYSKGWKIVETCERELGYPVVERQKGGKDGGRSRLTKEGRNIIFRFEKLERDMSEYCRKKYREIFKETKPAAGKRKTDHEIN